MATVPLPDDPNLEPVGKHADDLRDRPRPASATPAGASQAARLKGGYRSVSNPAYASTRRA